MLHCGAGAFASMLFRALHDPVPIAMLLTPNCARAEIRASRSATKEDACHQEKDDQAPGQYIGIFNSVRVKECAVCFA